MILRLNRPTGRSALFAPTVFLLYFFLEIAEFKFKSFNGSQTKSLFIPFHATGWYVVCIVMIVALALQWALSLSGRMLDLRISRIWMIPYLLPWVAVLFAIVKGSSHQILSAVFFALIVHMPLMLLPSRWNRKSSGEPSNQGPS